MLINCAISMYETKQFPSDPASGVGTSPFDIYICASSFGIYSQCVNGIVMVILCRRYPRNQQEYFGKMNFFLFENIGYF